MYISKNERMHAEWILQSQIPLRILEGRVVSRDVSHTLINNNIYL